jgi:hypothetical protein
MRGNKFKEVRDILKFYVLNSNLLSSRLLSKNLKIKIYRTITLLVVLLMQAEAVLQPA